MTNIEKIRAALGMARHAAEFCALPGLAAKTDEARAALAELERAATEPVAWIVGQQTMGGDVAEVLRWSRGTPPISVSGAPRPLYTAAQPAPGMPEWYGMDTPWPLHDVLAKLIEATGVLLDRHSYDDHGHEGVRYAQIAGKEILAALRVAAEIGKGMQG